LNSARRNLSEDELKTPGAIRLLISEIERSDDHCGRLQSSYESYQELRVTHAALEAKSKASRWHEVLSGLCLAIGSFGVAQSGNVPRAYWFSDQKVKAGDFVVLYSKPGTKSSKTSESGSTSYFYYRDQNCHYWIALRKPR
jgi:hypothetical protein